MAALAALIDGHVRGGEDRAYQDMVVDFRKTLAKELDYRKEAGRLPERMGKAFDLAANNGFRVKSTPSASIVFGDRTRRKAAPGR